MKVLENKKILRKEYLEKRKNVLDRERKTLVINKRIISCDKFINSNVIALYNSINSEVDISKTAKFALESGKILVYPKVINDTVMEFYRVDNLDEWQNGSFNIKEPLSGNLVTKDKIDLMILPGILFDTRKYRVGYGKGYYDRYIKNTNIYKIGIGFDEQIIDNCYIDNDQYDVSLDMIITDKRVI